MSRITKLSIDQWDPELRRMTSAETGTPLEQGLMRMMAHTPGIAKGIVALGSALRQNRALPDKLVEMVRLRIAFHNQCRSCMAIRYKSALDDGLDENLVCSLEKPQEADNLTDGEKAALKFADKFANDHLSIDDAMYDELRRHYAESEIVELGLWVAFCVGFGRLGATWDMIEELPTNFQDKSRTLTPWNEEVIQVRG